MKIIFITPSVPTARKSQKYQEHFKWNQKFLAKRDISMTTPQIPSIGQAR